MQLIESKKLIPYKRPFADCVAILLMSRWRAISLSKYFSIDASIISKYSLTATPLVGTRKSVPPAQLVVCSAAISLLYLLALKSFEEFASRTTITGCPLKGLFLCLVYWLTRKRVNVLF
ncbi:MAG: hypothetical protein UEA60_08265 [Lachnospiraceae bacterium]|nr:hypothetical protein [Lachnospiraceae bacterium]